jgi:hypothetical protein
MLGYTRGTTFPPVMSALVAGMTRKKGGATSAGGRWGGEEARMAEGHVSV